MISTNSWSYAFVICLVSDLSPPVACHRSSTEMSTPAACSTVTFEKPDGRITRIAVRCTSTIAARRFRFLKSRPATSKSVAVHVLAHPHRRARSHEPAVNGYRSTIPVVRELHTGQRTLDHPAWLSA
ncbi:MAG: hypothetical protein ACI9CV_001835, partial [Ilumatobacter sp.]